MKVTTNNNNMTNIFKNVTITTTTTYNIKQGIIS